MSDQTIRYQQAPPAAAVHASLRAWASGSYGDEAAVELLIRSFDGRFALPGWPWVAPRERPGEYWLDAEAINQATGQLSGGEQRVLAVVAALADSQPLERNLADVISGVDRNNQTLILAALSHAGGAHQHNDYQRRSDGTYAISEAGALVPWPETAGTEQDRLPLDSSPGSSAELWDRRSIPRRPLPSDVDRDLRPWRLMEDQRSNRCCTRSTKQRKHCG
ncbi:MAG: hypothetical protein ACR2LI_05125 [Propionibacteriaceae bacterium]